MFNNLYYHDVVFMNTIGFSKIMQNTRAVYVKTGQFFNLLINILLITIKAILKTCSTNKNVFTSKKSVGKT